ncbi:restriction endonuclease subunit S [Idiomarina sp.]|uniref:restriction endonuclease subunit S n=1 Tax=Idiomarina sp. TaxID=1874361 RepID=UPI001D281528|nr:restriction endonuclease subunit S [Idiomarina sp.]MCJ8317900.1 restriction endonuclease subunit S [Idiomarina sp.]NQZ17554.1 restriction endonuclease subunit S [Idiomarina sp.]
MVPEGWKKGKLNELADTVMGYAFKSSDFTYDGVPLLRMGNLYQNTLDLTRNPVYLPETFKDEFKRFLVQPGDLVMSMTGTMGKRDYGFTVVVPNDYPQLLLNQRVMKLIPKNGVSSNYLLSLLRSEAILSRMYSFPGGTKQANLSAKQVQELPALIPPAPEQMKIAQILSTWDKAITTTEQLLANSQQQKKALMQQLLTGKKRLLAENGVRFSGGWKDTALSEMGRIVSGGTPDTKNEDYWGGSVSWLTPTDVTALKSRYVEATSRTITEKGLKKSSATLLPPRSLMVCTRATVGAAAISTSEITTNQGFKNLIPSKQFDVEFIYYLVAHFNKKLTRKASGSTFLELSKRDFEKTSFNCPSLHEQKKISKTLSSADDEIEMLDTKLERLNREKKALMQQLLTGKRRVKFDDNAGDKTSYSF